MQTTPEQRDRLWAAAEDRGASPTAEESLALIHDAELAGHLSDAMDAISDALAAAGYRLIETTTDDDETPVFEVWADAATDSET